MLCGCPLMTAAYRQVSATVARISGFVRQDQDGEDMRCSRMATQRDMHHARILVKHLSGLLTDGPEQEAVCEQADGSTDLVLQPFGRPIFSACHRRL